MPKTERMVAVAIGVANAERLPYLPAALNGAGGLVAWASALGYETTLITDEDDDKPVTVERLRQTLETVLTANPQPIDRLVIYYAGHGLIREAEEGLWLVTDWLSDQRAVAVEPLKRRLYRYNVGQIAILSDACRVPAKDFDTGDLTPDGVLGKGPKSNALAPPIDKFVAAQDFKKTYAVPGATEKEDRCLFTGVLMQGLWGARKDAFSKVRTDSVTSQSLGTFLKAEVPRVAALYQRTLDPAVSYSFPEGEDVYFVAGVKAIAPTFPDWPPPDKVTPQGPIEPMAAEPSLSSSGVSGELAFILDHDENERAEKQPSRRHPRKPSAAKQLLAALRSQSLREFDAGCGFAINGPEVRRLWTPPRVFAEPFGQHGWWRIRSNAGNELGQPEPLLVEFSDGRFAATAALPHFVTSMVCDRRGVSGLIYRSLNAPPNAAAGAEVALAKMESGALRFDAAIDLAVELRRWKHADPVLGVISAYLYDSIGDVESIRRMAFYYTWHNQSIPYDIALLAQLNGKWRDGTLYVDVPPVAGRKPITGAEAAHSWTYEHTGPSSGTVGGLWPWMRQGWTFLDDPADDGSTLILPGLRELTRRLMPARFATLNNEGGRELAALFGLVERMPPLGPNVPMTPQGTPTLPPPVSAR